MKVCLLINKILLCGSGEKDWLHYRTHIHLHRKVSKLMFTSLNSNILGDMHILPALLDASSLFYAARCVYARAVDSNHTLPALILNY